MSQNASVLNVRCQTSSEIAGYLERALTSFLQKEEAVLESAGHLGWVCCRNAWCSDGLANQARSLAVRLFKNLKQGLAKRQDSGIISIRVLAPKMQMKDWAFSSGGERFPDTEEVTSSNLVTPTIFSLIQITESL